MTKVLYLDYISLIILGLIVFVLLIRTQRARKNQGIFAFLIGVSVFATLYDICAVLMDNSGSGGVVLKYILHGGYLVLRNLVVPVFGVYTIHVTDTWHLVRKNRLIILLLCLPFSAVALLTLSSPFTHLVYYMDSNDAYTRGPAFTFLYVTALCYTLLVLIHITKYYRVLKYGDRFIPLFSIVPLQLLAALVQFIYPAILCEMFCNSLCLLLIMLTVERPDGKTDQTLGIYKSSAFTDMFIQARGVEKPFTALLINITNYPALSSYLSTSQLDQLNRFVIEKLQAVEKELSLSPDDFYLNQGLFTSVLYNDNVRKAEDYANALTAKLNDEYTIGSYIVSVLINILVLKIPLDVSSIDAFSIVSKKFRYVKFSGEHTYASSVVNSKDYSVVSNMQAILKNAIENKEFEVYYQPIYSAKEKRFNSAEALIRLNSKEYGFIRPDLFIPIAEELGLIDEIGMFVLESVCQFISSKVFAKTGLDYIEVNLSVVQCMDKDLAFKIFSLIDEYNIKPSQLNLEITETASAYTHTNVSMNIDRLVEEGLSFSLDDFGTGYSNMVRIASLPLQIVKLDKSFTWTESTPDLKIILENSISMLKKMDMKIVVEGIETKEMLDTFTALGCDYIQGYYFSKPVPKSKFVEFLSKYEESAETKA